MDILELRELIAEIVDGRDEDTATEWKRQWWNFSIEEQRQEFVRDVAAMANANTKDRRLIVVGIGKGGQLFDSPLPCDEAELQQRLQAITPHPSVTFQVADVDGTRISILEVKEPFDRPYVAVNHNRNLIFYRQGTSIKTATRALLDRWYRESVGAADIKVLVDGVVLQPGITVASKRAWHRAESEGFHFTLPFQTDPAEQADLKNRNLWLRMALRNDGTRQAQHIVVDVELEPISDVRLWNRSSLPVSRPNPWQTDPNENVYVDGYGADSETLCAYARHRIARINPDTTEQLVPLGLLYGPLASRIAPPITVNYRVTAENGQCAKGTFHIQLVFEGEEIVRSERTL